MRSISSASTGDGKKGPRLVSRRRVFRVPVWEGGNRRCPLEAGEIENPGRLQGGRTRPTSSTPAISRAPVLRLALECGSHRDREPPRGGTRHNETP